MATPTPAKRPWLVYSAALLLFAGAVWYFGFRTEPPKASSNPFRSRSGKQATPVRAVPAEKTALAVHLRAIGTVTAHNTVTVRSRVEGPLLRVLFTEGRTVKQGELLAEVDPVPYQIRLTQMEARERQNSAQLQTARADLERFRLLHAQTLVTQQQLEAQQALVAEREALLAADRSQVEDARRQLAYTRIEAPIAGRLGLRQLDPGNLIRPGDAGGLVVITQTRPISVVFTIPEVDLQKVLEPLRAGQALPVEAWDRGEDVRLAAGEMRTVDNQIDLATGTLRLKAEFPNEDDRLFPNQFVNVRLRVRTITDAVVVPTACVQFGSRGTYVYVVNAESQAKVRDVVLGPVDGERQSIANGLAAGEQVVLEGIDRLRDGRSVTLVGADGTAPPAAPGAGRGDKAGPRGEKGAGKGEKSEKSEKGEKGRGRKKEQ
jgi:multidrug efflux system membrane fusion protein